VNNAFIGALSASDRQSSFTWAAGWSLVANVVLNVLLTPTFGYVGASWATVATEAVLFIAGLTLTARHIGMVPVVGLSWRAVIAGLVMGAIVFPMRDFEGFAIAVPIVVGVGVYAVAALLIRAVTRDEIRLALRALAPPQ
jgi:O-antigen/teichoic acid export membrane protein